MGQTHEPHRVSYLTSLLARQCAGLETATFRARYPHAWVLWEPGAWVPPERDVTSTLAVRTAGAPPVRPGEALALALVGRGGAEGEVRLGRAAECDLHINDRTLSQVHLVFLPERGGGWAVRDAGSKNGAFLNGARLPPFPPMPLQDGARLVCAQVSLTFHTSEGLFARLTRPPA